MSNDGGSEPVIGPAQALSALRTQMDDARAALGLTKTQLASRAGLGRTVVSQAFSSAAEPPTKNTVGALARALRLPLPPLLALLASGVGDGSDGCPGAVGRPISDWDPLDLEVHPAASPRSAIPSGRHSDTLLPSYVRRPHDETLAQVVQTAANGRSQLAVLVGFSSTGKTRACWEAVQPLAHMGWRLWHPFAPSRAEAALAGLARVGRRTVVWLNEAQHYLGAGQGRGDRLAAEFATLLNDADRAPILVLCTIWPEYADVYTALPSPEREDGHSHVRALLANRRISVPDKFDAAAIDAAQALADAGDEQLAVALSRSTDGCLTQELAGAPELLHRYRTAQPAARAVLRAAMDARRLGVNPYLPLAFLQEAAEDYLADAEYDALPDDWFEQALADLARPVHGRLAPLRRTRSRRLRRATGYPSSSAPLRREGPLYRLADYLEEHGRQERAVLCPPASFWHSAHNHLTDSDDLANLAQAALQRYRLQWAFRLQNASGVCSETGAGVQACVVRIREAAGDEEWANQLLQREAAAGRAWALLRLAARYECSGDRGSAERLLRKAADANHIGALVRLLALRKEAGDKKEAERLASEAASLTGRPPHYLPGMLLLDDDRELEGGKPRAASRSAHYMWFAPSRDIAMNPDGSFEVLFATAEELARLADLHGAQALLDRARDEKASDPEAAVLARKAADSGEGDVRTEALYFLAHLRADAGHFDESEAVAQEMTGSERAELLSDLAERRGDSGDYDGAERSLQRAIDAGSTYALLLLADMRQSSGDTVGAEALAQRASQAGDASAFLWLAQNRHATGIGPTKDLVRKAADAGAFHEHFLSHDVEPWRRHGARPWLVESMTAWWPYGLDPDGSPTQPW